MSNGRYDVMEEDNEQDSVGKKRKRLFKAREKDNEKEKEPHHERQKSCQASDKRATEPIKRNKRKNYAKKQRNGQAIYGPISPNSAASISVRCAVTYSVEPPAPRISRVIC